MALIEKIERKIREKNIYIITLNTGEFFEVYDEQIILNSLKEGKEIEVEELQEISNKSQEKIATDYSVQVLSRGMKSEKELREKLKQKKFNQSVINSTIQKMQTYGYLNDELFATTYFSYHKEHKGKKKIAFELAQKGIDSKIINNLCEEVEDQCEIAQKIAQKYLKNKVLDFKCKTKLYSHLVSKGFDFETINSTLNEFSWSGENFE